MARSRIEIEQLKQIARLEKAVKEEAKKVLPSIYACLAKVLYEQKGMSADEIAEIFCATQETWTEAIDREDTIIEWCEETTGIKLMSDEYIG